MVLHSSKSFYYPKLCMHFFSALWRCIIFFISFFFFSLERSILKIICPCAADNCYTSMHMLGDFLPSHHPPSVPFPKKRSYKSFTVVDNAWQECAHFLGLVWWGFLISGTFMKTLCHWQSCMFIFSYSEEGKGRDGVLETWVNDKLHG